MVSEPWPGLCFVCMSTTLSPNLHMPMPQSTAATWPHHSRHTQASSVDQQVSPAGSVDEQEHEQGIAHFVEHITFLGSKKRESLLGTGARSNAYTDFHHTVFHVHAPLINGTTGTPMLPQVGYMHSTCCLYSCTCMPVACLMPLQDRTFLLQAHA